MALERDSDSEKGREAGREERGEREREREREREWERREQTKTVDNAETTSIHIHTQHTQSPSPTHPLLQPKLQCTFSTRSITETIQKVIPSGSTRLSFIELSFIRILT